MFACLHASGVFDHELLVELAYCFSPKIEETASDTVVLDIAGCELLFGTPAEIAESIAQQASDRGLAVNAQKRANGSAELSSSTLAAEVSRRIGFRQCGA